MFLCHVLAVLYGFLMLLIHFFMLLYGFLMRLSHFFVLLYNFLVLLYDFLMLLYGFLMLLRLFLAVLCQFSLLIDDFFVMFIHFFPIQSYFINHFIKFQNFISQSNPLQNRLVEFPVRVEFHIRDSFFVCDFDDVEIRNPDLVQRHVLIREVFVYFRKFVLIKPTFT